MELTLKQTKDLMAGFFERCAEAKAVGIALCDAVEAQDGIPADYWFDYQTQYYLPPGFQFSQSAAIN